MMSPFSTTVSEGPQLSRGRAKEELFSTPVWSCSRPRNLKTELRNRDEARKKYETQAAPNRKAACGVVAAMAGCLRAVPSKGADAGCMQVRDVWLFHEADVVSWTSLYPARVSITNGGTVTEKKPKRPTGLMDKCCTYLSFGRKANLQYAGREQTGQPQCLPVLICKQPPHRQFKQDTAVPVCITICKLIYSLIKHTGRGGREGKGRDRRLFLHCFLLWILFQVWTAMQED